jgi:hypothetical protein
MAVPIKPTVALTKVKVRSRALMALAILTELCTSGDSPSELEERGGPYHTHGGPYESHESEPETIEARGGPYETQGGPYHSDETDGPVHHDGEHGIPQGITGRLGGRGWQGEAQRNPISPVV